VSLAFALTGAGAIKFFATALSVVLGWAMLALAGAITLLGVWRFRQMAGHLAAARKPPASQAG
jgi:hypothetical protein